MAFPTIDDADTKNGTVTTNATSWTLTYPTNIAVGDLLMAFLAIDGTSGASLPAGWIQKVNFSSGANVLNVQVKLGLGTETGTFTATIGASEQGSWRIFRFPVANWFGGSLGTADIDDAAGVSFVTSPPAGSPSANPNPPSLNPPGWGTEDTLWLAPLSVDTSRTISVYPLAGRNTADVSGGAGGATLGLCTVASAVASLDPGTYTISASDDWTCDTMAVRPSGRILANPTIFQNPGLFSKRLPWWRRPSGIFVPDFKPQLSYQKEVM